MKGKIKSGNWHLRNTRQLTISSLRRLIDNSIWLDEDAPVVFKNVIGYDEDDYYLTWEYGVDDETGQVEITLQPPSWYYGSKAKAEEDAFQDEYDEKYDFDGNKTDSYIEYLKSIDEYYDEEE
tara:strand:+ start:1028 stop:1396 length:369 start_codon:yes stop_codon:yes gene_type:complete